MKECLYHIRYKWANFTNKYMRREKGDTSTFRYPHLKYLFKNFDSDLKDDIFLLKRNEEDVLKAMAKESMVMYENVSNKAYEEFIYRLFGIRPFEETRMAAYRDIKKKYPIKIKKTRMRELDFNIIPFNENFMEIKDYLKHSFKYPTYVYFLPYKNNRNLTHSYHGTNVLIVDETKYNYGVGLIEALINNENGIKGNNNKYINVEESWAKVPLMALENYIKEPVYLDADMFFIKGFLAKAFNEEDALYNSLYAFTEPFIKLLFSSINMHELLEYVFKDNEELVKNRFNQVYPDFYDKIYKEKNIFNRIDIVKEIALYHHLDLMNLYKTLFNSKSLVKTNIDYHVVALFYLSERLRDEAFFIDLLTTYETKRIKKNQKIEMNDLKKHIKSKYGVGAYRLFTREEEKYKDILEQI